MFRSFLYSFTSLQLRKYCTIPRSLTVKEALLTKPFDKAIVIRGWVQSVRKHKDIFFVDLIDGTCFHRLQIIIDANKYSQAPSYGSSIRVEGSIVKSLHKGQEVELIAKSWETYGVCGEDYPFYYHHKFSSEYIRQYVHLRPKSRMFSSILRIRNQASMAVHNFFQNEGYCFVHTPIITQNDCEGAGEVFSVQIKNKDRSHLKEKAIASNNAVTPEKKDESSVLNPEDSNEEFFGVPTYLTVSGQLHLEAIASSFARVYNFGPTFRAESSQTRLHASEFQMIEAEIAFTESVHDLIEVVERLIKSVTKSLMESCGDDINLVSESLKNHKDYLDALLFKPFVQMSYNEAMTILEKNRKGLKAPVKFGEDFSTDHKKFLVKYCNNIPVFVSMFPSSLKPFYMKTDENKVAHCFDLFASYGGEICGGSLREDNESVLREKHTFEENSNLLWYLDLRKYGSVPHGGFGIGFERFLQMVLGIQNIRDLIPFPRRKYDCVC